MSWRRSGDDGAALWFKHTSNLGQTKTKAPLVTRTDRLTVSCSTRMFPPRPPLPPLWNAAHTVIVIMSRAVEFLPSLPFLGAALGLSPDVQRVQMVRFQPDRPYSCTVTASMLTPVVREGMFTLFDITLSDAWIHFWLIQSQDGLSFFLDVTP